MMYALIILLGLAISFLLFPLLNNETRVQNQQVTNFFDNVALFLKSKRAYIENDSTNTNVYPILSTSVTCGRCGSAEKHQLDLPIVTPDEELQGTAAEFCIEPDAENLQLYIRLLEQPYLWVYNEEHSSISLIVKNLNDYSTQEDAFEWDKNKIPPLPFALKTKLKANQDIPKPKLNKSILHIGDSVFLGNTEFTVIHYKRRDK